MIATEPRYLLFIEPTQPKSSQAVRDHLTVKMQHLIRQAVRCESYFGYHTCVCGKQSDCHDWKLPSGHITNALAVHYLAWHRTEVPVSEIEKLKAISLRAKSG